MIETGTLWIEGNKANNYSLELVSLLKATENEIGEWIDDPRDISQCGWTSLEESSEVLDILAKKNFASLDCKKTPLGNYIVFSRCDMSWQFLYLWIFKDCRCKYCDDTGISLVEMIEDLMAHKTAFVCEHHFNVFLLERAFRRGTSEETEILL